MLEPRLGVPDCAALEWQGTLTGCLAWPDRLPFGRLRRRPSVAGLLNLAELS